MGSMSFVCCAACFDLRWTDRARERVVARGTRAMNAYTGDEAPTKRIDISREEQGVQVQRQEEQEVIGGIGEARGIRRAG